ncbi:hypothetical protein QBC36DRAFT_201026, partial [Triangularia setosa]
WAWEHDPYTCGAFALFGPGQLENLYPPFQELLANSQLSICSEAISVHHAWIYGALDSALFAVLTFLAKRSADSPEMQEKAQKLLYSHFNPDRKYLKEHPGADDRTVHPERDDRLAYWCAQVSPME